MIVLFCVFKCMFGRLWAALTGRQSMARLRSLTMASSLLLLDNSADWKTSVFRQLLGEPPGVWIGVTWGVLVGVSVGVTSGVLANTPWLPGCSGSSVSCNILYLLIACIMLFSCSWANVINKSPNPKNEYCSCWSHFLNLTYAQF